MERKKNIESSAIYFFRETLFLDTVKWCYNRSSFYRKKFGSTFNEVNKLSDISKLPILFRDEIIENFDAMQCNENLPSHVQYTTGTTGNFLQLNRSYEETLFINKFYSTEIENNIDRGTIRPLFLSLISAWHGSPTPIPGWAYVLQAGVYDRTQAQAAKNLLLKTYKFPNVTPKIVSILGTEILVKALTAYLIEEQINPSDLGIKYLIVTGGYLSSLKKKLLNTIWNATLIDRYSMSEIFGSAREIGNSGKWSFDIELIPEVVHPKTLKPLNSGIGILVLTGLYPFMQTMPLIRYYTGDLVEIKGDYDFGKCNLLVKFLGREKWSIIETTEDEVIPLILAGPLYEIIESLPDIAISSRFSDLGIGGATEIAGKHHFNVLDETDSLGQRHIEITVGLRYTPWHFPEATARLCTIIRKKLYESSRYLKEKVIDGSIDLRIVPLPYSKVKPFTMK